MSLLINAKWNAFSQLFKIGIQAINLIYLAKIIPPNEYGLMAMASVVISLGILLRDLGTSAALIQQKIITESLKNTVFWLNLILGISIAIVICLLSKPMANFYSQPKLYLVLILISITFPLSSCAAAHLALMERNSEFKKISLIEVGSSLMSVIAAIFLAKCGYGVFSLVGQAIVLNLISAILFWTLSKWRPSLKFFISSHDIKNIFKFSMNLSIFNLINYLSRSGDSFIIGKYMSSIILGNYNLAYRIMLFPLQSLTFVASRSLYPVLSRNQDDNKLIYDSYINCVFVITFLSAPLMSGIAFLSEPLINIVFGDKWVLTASILKWLAPTAIIQSILSTTGSVFSAKGRTDILMRLGILGTVLQFGSFLIGVHYNIITFAFLYFIANILNFIPVMISLMNVISGSLLNLLKLLFPIVISTLIMLIGLYFISGYINNLGNINSIPKLVVVSGLASLIYISSIFCCSSKFRHYFFKKVS